jgi:hypothetical protein
LCGWSPGRAGYPAPTFQQPAAFLTSTIASPSGLAGHNGLATSFWRCGGSSRSDSAASQDICNSPVDEQAGALFQNLVIHGGQNVVGVGSQVAQTIQPSLPARDLVALLDYVRGIEGVTENDVIELQEALENDEEPSEPGSFGSRVNAWLGKMATKSIESASGTAAVQGVQLLAKAIGQYYNLPAS